MLAQSLFFKTISNIGNCMITNNRLITWSLPSTQLVSLKHTASHKVAELNIPEKPKRPLTPYMRFVKANKAELLKQQPDSKQSELVKLSALKWKTVDPSLKEKYEAEYKSENEAYARLYLAYTAKLTDEQKQALKELSLEKRSNKQKRVMRKKNKEEGKPKKPLTPHMQYMMDLAKQENKKIPELMKEIKDRFHALSEIEKQKYEIKYKTEKEKFDKDLKAWEEKMISEGKTELVRQATLIEKSSATQSKVPSVFKVAKAKVPQKKVKSE
uniref:Mitochondrial transcription factor A n=1 Tax=Dastarcus helophoroides TaxID=1169899 RepID=A0A166IWC7_9CUCU|nr:mitochondrial transcription factor A [Dastarcus helophoroides]